MPLPPKGDPRRGLHLAIRWMRVLGGLLLLFATGACIVGALTALLYLLPVGLCFIVLPIYLRRRQFWAVVASTCLASVASLVPLLALVKLVLFFDSQPFHSAMLIPLGVLLLMLLGFAQLIYHLSRSFDAIKYLEPAVRGFEPIMVPPATAAEMYQQREPRHEQPPPGA